MPESVQNFVSVHKAELGRLGAPDSCSVLGRLVHVFPLRRTPRKEATEAQNGSCTSAIGQGQPPLTVVSHGGQNRHVAPHFQGSVVLDSPSSTNLQPTQLGACRNADSRSAALGRGGSLAFWTGAWRGPGCCLRPHMRQRGAGGQSALMLVRSGSNPDAT